MLVLHPALNGKYVADFCGVSTNVVAQWRRRGVPAEYHDALKAHMGGLGMSGAIMNTDTPPRQKAPRKPRHGKWAVFRDRAIPYLTELHGADYVRTIWEGYGTPEAFWRYFYRTDRRTALEQEMDAAGK